MSALPISQPQNPGVASKLTTSQAEIIGKKGCSSRIGERQKTIKLSQRKRASASLVLLKFCQKGSAFLAVSTMAGSLAIYLSTVRIPQLWSQEYESLETLQRQEQQLVAIDEALKYEIARQAEKVELEMLPISSERTLFLERSQMKPQVKTVRSKADDRFKLIPFGY